MVWARRILPLALLFATACSERTGPAVDEPPAQVRADLVFVNGGIYTVDADRSWAEAAAVRDGVIVRVGTNAEVNAMVGPETRVVDLAGRMALPAFHDAHVHTHDGGLALIGCSVEGLQSVEAIIEKVTDCALSMEDGWLEGHAFDLSLFDEHGPHKSLLDAVSSVRPIVVWGSDYHNVWVNSVALELAGITEETPDPPLGVIERDPDGSPSGTLREEAQDMLRAAMPQPTLDTYVARLRAGIRYLNSMGITSYIDGWVWRDLYRAYQALEEAGELTARVVTSLPYESFFGQHKGEEFWRVLEERAQFESDRVSHDSVKLFLDGVLEGETAALLEPYLGAGETRGELMFEPEALKAIATRFDAMGLQLQIHTIGDRAARAGLDAIEAARNANGPSDNRHHIVHLQLIHSDDIPRLAQLDVTANFQALWAYPDEYITKLNLPAVGPERVNRMYPIGSVVRAGGRIAGGSDWNVSTPNPLAAIEVGVRRQDPLQQDGPVLNEDERVSLATMIDAYTINAAWLMHHENLVGSIEVGKRADIVVLDRNLFEIAATEIDEAAVVMTLLDGETVWSSESASDAAN